jgi:hypothetical protein
MERHLTRGLEDARVLTEKEISFSNLRSLGPPSVQNPCCSIWESFHNKEAKKRPGGTEKMERVLLLSSFAVFAVFASLREYIPAVWPLLLYVIGGLGEARPTLPSPLRASACLLFIVAAPPGARRVRSRGLQGGPTRR